MTNHPSLFFCQQKFKKLISLPLFLLFLNSLFQVIQSPSDYVHELVSSSLLCLIFFLKPSQFLMFVLQFILIELTNRFKFINLIEEQRILILQILVLIDKNFLEDLVTSLLLVALKILVGWWLWANPLCLGSSFSCLATWFASKRKAIEIGQDAVIQSKRVIKQ